MVEILLYYDGTVFQTLGLFTPVNVEDVLELLRKYGVEDDEGNLLKVHEIRFDVGLSPHIAVFLDVEV